MRPRRSVATSARSSGSEPLGISATNNARGARGSPPDCVVYAASGPDRGAGAVPDYERLLSQGINVVTTTSTELVFPPVCDAALRDRLDRAAAAGGASLYASGIFPGSRPTSSRCLLTTQSSSIRPCGVIEISFNDHYPVADVMLDGMGFGRPLDFEPFIGQPGIIPIVWQAPIQLDRRGARRRARRDPRTARPPLTDRDHRGRVRHDPGRHRRRGAHDRERDRRRAGGDRRRPRHQDVAGRRSRSGRPRTTMPRISSASRASPTSTCACRSAHAEGHDAGDGAMTATAMRVVNAVPHVVDAPPGLLSSLDLPLTLPRHAF